MDTIKRINEHIDMLSIDVKDILFEELWEVPDGVTVNSFIVKGDKIALVDGVCGWDGVPERFHQLLERLEIDLQDIKYLIINHMEPDHSGWIEDFRKIKDDFEIYCTKKAADLIEAFYGNLGTVHVVKKGDVLDLGNGVEIEFTPVPNLHWPDTMRSFERSSKTLLTCDMFGTFGTLREQDKELQADLDSDYWTDNMIRYFSNVLGTYRVTAKRAISSVRALDPAIIAPAHGPIHYDPKKITDQYEKIVDMIGTSPLEEVAILYSSMYGMTEKAVLYAKDRLEELGLKVHLLKTSKESAGTVVSKAYRCKYIIVATPTYEAGMLPDVAHAIDELGRKKITDKKAFLMGSYGWSSQTKKELEEILQKHAMNWEIIGDYPFLGSPKDEDFTRILEFIHLLIGTENRE